MDTIDAGSDDGSAALSDLSLKFELGNSIGQIFGSLDQSDDESKQDATKRFDNVDSPRYALPMHKKPPYTAIDLWRQQIQEQRDTQAREDRQKMIDKRVVPFEDDSATTVPKIQISQRFHQVHEHIEKAQVHLNALGELCQQSNISIHRSQALQNDLALKFHALSEHTRAVLKQTESDSEEEENENMK